MSQSPISIIIAHLLSTSRPNLPRSVHQPPTILPHDLHSFYCLRVNQKQFHVCDRLNVNNRVLSIWNLKLWLLHRHRSVLKLLTPHTSLHQRQYRSGDSCIRACLSDYCVHSCPIVLQARCGSLSQSSGTYCFMETS